MWTTDSLVGKVFNTPREILQYVGTEFIRDGIHPDWHCMAALSDKNLTRLLCNKGPSSDPLVAVTDCRFPNEFNYLLNKFQDEAKFYYVERPEAEEILSNASHKSELEILNVKDLIVAHGGEIIQNNSDLKNLTKKVKDVALPESSTEGGKPKPGSRFRWSQVN
jgi:hypothetical protein